jgi:hypothetical protein
LLIAFTAHNRAIIDAAGRDNALTPDSFIAIVIAAAAAEAFINELAENIGIYRQNASDRNPDAITPRMAAAADAVFKLERKRASIHQKYLAVSKALSGRKFPKSRGPYKDFGLLIELRNSIMHLKPVRPSEPHPGEKVTRALVHRGIAIDTGPLVSFPWFNRLETPAVATWPASRREESFSRSWN